MIAISLQPLLISIQEASKILNIPLCEMYDLVKSEDFPAIKIGRKWRIIVSRLEQWAVSRLEERPNNIGTPLAPVRKRLGGNRR
ncbi:helix-turn-helix domain-containing protein [Anaeroselena agilis]|uniref:helix-turn-helix domain-containing protein n=1 Tax=Anaeroselena agilis TaxID=3063788 RepID=UPI0039B6FE41